MPNELELAEPGRERLCGALADVLYPERIEKAGQRRAPAVVDGLDQVLGPFRRDLAGPHRLWRRAVAFVGAALHLEQIIEFQLVQIGDRAHIAEITEFLDVAFAETFDVHRAARGEVEDRLRQLRGARQTARAARDRFALLAHDRRAADRAMRRHVPRLRVRRTLVVDDADDLGNHVARAAHDDRVADAHVETRNLVGVVQRRVGHGDAADEHGLELRRRRRRARAADVDDDVLDGRRLFLRGELVRDRPARRAPDEAEFALQGEIVDLVDHAVDVERQLVALVADALVVVEAAVGAGRGVDERANGQAPLAQRAQHLRVRRGQRAAFDDADGVGEERERASCRDRAGRAGAANRRRRCAD